MGLIDGLFAMPHGVFAEDPSSVAHYNMDINGLKSKQQVVNQWTYMTLYDIPLGGICVCLRHVGQKKQYLTQVSQKKELLSVLFETYISRHGLKKKKRNEKHQRSLSIFTTGGLLSCHVMSTTTYNHSTSGPINYIDKKCTVGFSHKMEGGDLKLGLFCPYKTKHT